MLDVQRCRLNFTFSVKSQFGYRKYNAVWRIPFLLLLHRPDSSTTPLSREQLLQKSRDTIRPRLRLRRRADRGTDPFPPPPLLLPPIPPHFHRSAAAHSLQLLFPPRIYVCIECSQNGVNKLQAFCFVINSSKFGA